MTRKSLKENKNKLLKHDACPSVFDFFAYERQPSAHGKLTQKRRYAIEEKPTAYLCERTAR